MSLTITEIISGDTAASVSLTALTRSDNGATPAGVTIPLAFTNPSGGTWEAVFTATDSTPPNAYNYLFTVTWTDSSTSNGSGRIASGTAATGRYTSEALMDDTAGTYNISIYSDLNADGVINRVVLQRAIDKAENELDDLMRSGVYVVPFTGTIPPAIERWATEMAIWQLYRNRGTRADDGVGDKMKAAYDQARKEARIAAFSDLIQLDTTRNPQTPTGAFVVAV